MILISIIFLLVILFCILIYKKKLKLLFIFDTDSENMDLTFFWIYPLLKVEVNIVSKKPVITVFLFRKKIYSNEMKAKKGRPSGLTLARSIKYHHLCITSNYGFQDKFTTGIACGAVNVASKFVDIESFENIPDFMSMNDYIYLKVTTEINILSAISSYIKVNKSPKYKLLKGV